MTVGEIDEYVSIQRQWLDDAEAEKDSYYAGIDDCEVEIEEISTDIRMALDHRDELIAAMP